MPCRIRSKKQAGANIVNFSTTTRFDDDPRYCSVFLEHFVDDAESKLFEISKFGDLFVCFTCRNAIIADGKDLPVFAERILRRLMIASISIPPQEKASFRNTSYFNARKRWKGKTRNKTRNRKILHL